VHPRARHLIDTHALAEHPEGGWYRQVFKSNERVTRQHDGAGRSALTTIEFLLVEGTHSAWHRVQSDEAWHFYEGDPLELLVRIDARETTVTLDPDHRVHVVPPAPGSRHGRSAPTRSSAARSARASSSRISRWSEVSERRYFAAKFIRAHPRCSA
jgi:hypothetical protein